MTKTAEVTGPAKPRTFWNSLLAIGPGIVYLLSSAGPNDLVSNSAAGANFGYSLLWTLLVIGAAHFVLLEATARFVIATGESMLSAYVRVARWVPWVFLGAIVARRHLSNLYHVLLLGIALGWLTGAQSPASLDAFSLASCAAAFAVMYLGSYRTAERFCKPLALFLGLTVLLTVVLARPDPVLVWEGITRPSLPPDSGSEGVGLGTVLLLLVGAGVGSLNNLKYSAFVYAKGWRDPSHLRTQRIDLVVSCLGAFLLAAALQMAAAAVLRPLGLKANDVEDLVPLFTVALGQLGKVLMAVGLWTTVFSTYMSSNTGYALMVCDILAALQNGKQTPEQRGRLRRWILVIFCVSPMYVLWTNWKPVPLVVASSLLMTLAVPMVTVLLLCIVTDRKRLGAYANGPLATAAMLIIVAASLVVTYRGVVEIFTR